MRFFKWLKEKTNFHWQNLNEISTRYNICYSGIRYGRCWFSLYKLRFCIECLLSAACHANVEIGGEYGESDLKIGLAFSPVSFWFTIEEGLFPIKI